MISRLSSHSGGKRLAIRVSPHCNATLDTFVCHTTRTLIPTAAAAQRRLLGHVRSGWAFFPLQRPRVKDLPVSNVSRGAFWRLAASFCPEDPPRSCQPRPPAPFPEQLRESGTLARVPPCCLLHLSLSLASLSLARFIFCSFPLSHICSHVCLVAHRWHARSHFPLLSLSLSSFPR